MDQQTPEQALRWEAIRRRLAGETRRSICQALERATSWFDKWWAEYRRQPRGDLADRSRVPHTSPKQVPAKIVAAIVRIRKTLEAADSAATRYSPIGQRAIAGQLTELKVDHIPSLRSIQRILQTQGLTHPLGAGEAKAYYPWPTAWEVNAIQATDIITRHVRGGLAIENFHTIDHYSHAIWLGQYTNSTSATTRQFLLENWAHLGLPRLHQFDNEGCFSGGHTHPHVIGQVVRLCLFCGIEPLFTPAYDPKRNYQIETFHSLWLRLFWQRHHFRNLAMVQRLAPNFRSWYQAHYRPPSLDGLTPNQMLANHHQRLLTADRRTLIPNGRLPLTAGRVHFMRKVSGDGLIHLLNEPWLVGRRWAGEYVRATLDLTQQRLTIWQQADADSPWRMLKRRQFRLKEPVHDPLPAFRRKCTRCRDYYPG